MLEDLKRLFRGNNFIGQMILINASVFVLTNVASAIFFKGDDSPIFQWLGIPGTISEFILVPWTAITYMFMHGGLWHIAFNMYMFYWFGRIFSDFLGEKRLTGLYFLGGISGGILFLLAYSIMYLGGEPLQGSVLVGASAAVMAVTIAVGVRFPDYVIHLFLFGAVRLKYVALVIFILSTVLDFTINTGGKIAHLGGAIFGFLYARGLDQGKDYALGFYEFFEGLGKRAKKAPRMKVVSEDKKTRQRTRPSSSSSHTASSSNEDQAKTDAILDKISKSGYDNLTKEEKEFLFKLSNKP